MENSQQKFFIVETKKAYSNLKNFIIIMKYWLN